MVDRLPARAVLVGREGHRLPVADVVPLGLKLAVDPAELVLAPGLHLPVLDVGVLARLALHENVVAVDERRLIVHQQVAGGIGSHLLLGHERVVDDLGLDVRARLRGHPGEAGVGRVPGPLAPERLWRRGVRDCAGEDEQEHPEDRL